MWLLQRKKKRKYKNTKKIFCPPLFFFNSISTASPSPTHQLINQKYYHLPTRISKDKKKQTKWSTSPQPSLPPWLSPPVRSRRLSLSRAAVRPLAVEPFGLLAAVCPPLLPLFFHRLVLMMNGEATNNAQLRDLVFQTKGTRPTAVQADNMVFTCPSGRLVYESLCATGDCISGDGIGGCGHGAIDFP